MFPDSGRLITRIVHAVSSGQKITFLFGSALTAQGARPDEKGVPDVGALINDVVKSFHGSDQMDNLEQALNQAEVKDRYQTAMQFMIDCRGQGALNELIAEAVQKAREKSRGSEETDEEIELDTDGWFLRPGVEAVGRLIHEHPTRFAAPILTSNFDPLLEVSLRKAGASAATISLSGDGQFTNILGTDSSVVHFHGFWRGAGNDTLHTPTQLSRFRPMLKGCLRRLLRETVLVVMGYGGWSDVFTKTLVEVISEQTDELDVLWTFYSDNEEDLKTRNKDLLDKFDSLVGQRVVIYKGVDCHVVLPLLRERLANPDKKQRVAPVSLAADESAEKTGAVDIKAYGDHPPQADVWVGREGELLAMLESKAKAIAITGLGGSGKSTLAAKYLEWRKGTEDISFYCWSDCREQSNTLHTQLVRMIEKISLKAITAEQLKDSTTENVIEVLFDTLGSSEATLVFDNIDQYVDLEQGKTTGAMHILLERAMHKVHSSTFLFTGRPTIEYVHPAFLQLKLEGLSIDEAQQLFLMRGVQLDPTKSLALMNEVHELTRGHALALNLIATQVSKNKINLSEFLLKLRSGLEEGVEIEILPEIWATLNLKQQTVLRYLAELVHADTEQRIASYLGNVLKYNQFSKAIKALKMLSLVVIKSPGKNLPDVLELHPLVRDFIKRRFHKEERIPYIHSIILFCDRMIVQFRAAITDAPRHVLENWTDKVELCLECERYDEALEVLDEVHFYLRKSGLLEEFVRLAVEVLSRISLPEDTTQVTKYDRLFGNLIHALSALGRYAEADAQIKNLSATIPAKTARYILLCDVTAFSYFLRYDYVNAKLWANEGDSLKKSTGIDTQNDCSHTLALAQRETGDVDVALKYFMKGEALETLLDPTKIDHDRGGHFYGNIARCFYYQNKLDEAIICLKKSAISLERSYDSHILLNHGWAANWIGEAMEKKCAYNIAYAAFRTAWLRWKTVSPLRGNEALKSCSRIKSMVADESTLPKDDAECERMYLAWIKRN